MSRTHVCTAHVAALCLSLFIPLMTRHASAQAQFCATGGPESVLRCITEAYAKQDFEAYDRLLADDFRSYIFVPESSEPGWPGDTLSSRRPVPPGDEQLFQTDGPPNGMRPSPPEYARERELDDFRKMAFDWVMRSYSVSFPDGYEIRAGQEPETWIIDHLTMVEEVTLVRSVLPPGASATSDELRHTGQRMLVRRVTEPAPHFEIVAWVRPGGFSSRSTDLKDADSFPPRTAVFERVIRGPGYTFRIRPPERGGVLKETVNRDLSSRARGFISRPLTKQSLGVVAWIGSVGAVSVDRWPDPPATLDQLATAALAEYQLSSPGTVVTRSDSLVTEDGRKVPVVCLEGFTGETAKRRGHSILEAIAFILEDSVIVRIGSYEELGDCGGGRRSVDESRVNERLRAGVQGYSSVGIKP
jgi:hypothetical protein